MTEAVGVARGGVARGETTAEGEPSSGGGWLSGCGVFWRDEKVERRNPASKSGDEDPKLGDLASATLGDMKICCRAGEAIAAFRKGGAKPRSPRELSEVR